MKGYFFQSVAEKSCLELHSLHWRWDFFSNLCFWFPCRPSSWFHTAHDTWEVFIPVLCSSSIWRIEIQLLVFHQISTFIFQLSVAKGFTAKLKDVSNKINNSCIFIATQHVIKPHSSPLITGLLIHIAQYFTNSEALIPHISCWPHPLVALQLYVCQG